jgi:hypothetical protein
MIDMFFRLIIAGGLIIGTAYLPVFSTGAAGTSLRMLDQTKAFRTCPPQLGAFVRACMA